MVIGKAGTGKSVFASTFPEPAFLFDFDKGALTYRGKDVDYEQFPLTAKGWVEFEKVFAQVEKDVLAGKYKTVIFDSASTLTDLAMERAMMLDPKRSQTGGPLWNVHYQMVRNLVEGRIQKFVNLPCNLVLTAHIDIVTDAESGAVIDARPLLTGQLSIKIPGLFDEVYFATTKTKNTGTEFYLQTVPKGFFAARSRISGKERLLPDYVPNDFNEIMNLANTASKSNAQLNKK
jgi:hypothetical protein